VFNHRDISLFPGLAEAEASELLIGEGYNELPSSRRRSIGAIALDVIREPMFLLLVACGAMYLILGDIREAMLLLSFVFVIMGITLYQERKTERALEALRDMTSPRALVIRDGRERRIPGREVVRGDILVLAEGDRVPADAVVLACVNLTVDESLLTGESVPVRKAAAEGTPEMAQPGGDDLPFVYSGTMVVQGHGIARVHATGVRTQLGLIGRALQAVEHEDTLLKKEMGRMVRLLAMVGFTLCALVVVVYGMTRGDWLHGFLAGITLAMALLPEEFPVVLTIFLALGAWRMSQQRVLTRQVPAIETLGSATVLCVDKTGTLTLNQMSVRTMFARGRYHSCADSGKTPLPETFHELLEFGILASQTDPFDPMEKAIKQLGEWYLAQTEHLHGNWTLVHEYPLSKELLSLSRVWKSPDGEDYVIAAKGAPEAIADLCHLGEEQLREMAVHIGEMADEGLRVLGIARAGFRPVSLPSGQHDFSFEFLGLIGLADPVRPAVPEAIKECSSAGIRVVMITGDYPGTARNIAHQIGLPNHDVWLTGPELNAMSDSELEERIGDVNIFARVVPEQKLRIVKALKAVGEIVAMTGDGVNDAPALKSAHIGIAMGGRGTDVARESSALVLLDDDFSSIVRAVRMGRRIFDNIRKAIAYIFAIHVPIAGMSLIPVLLDWPLVLLPVHIVFLELIIDPACSVVFEAEREESDVMNRPPRNPGERLFGAHTILPSLLQGTIVLLMALAVFGVAMYGGRGEAEARALSFTTLIVANLGLILTNRSWSRTILEILRSPNSAQWFVLGGAAAFMGLVLTIPFLRDLFRFDRLHPDDILICIAAGATSVLWFEGLKLFRARAVQKTTRRATETS
jgi:Ca2+-transporting ATPase